MKGYALITGASSGIGRSLAIKLAQQGFDLLLTARSEDKIKELAQQTTTQHGVKAEYLPLDLSKEDAPAAIADWCSRLKINPALLINNAGYGLWGNFDALDLNEELNMHRLNTESLIKLTYLLLPLLKANPKSYILNVASTAAYQAVPTLAVYSATKAFVLIFSRGLRMELKDSGVIVSCLCPGPTDTGFTKRAGMDAMAEVAEKFNMDADEVAAIALKGLFKGKAEIVPGLLNKLSVIGVRHLPKALPERIAAKLYQKK